MREDVSRDLQWLEFYGIMRLLGKSVPEAVSICEQPRELLAATLSQAFAELHAVRTAQFSSQWRAIQSGVAVIPVVGGALSTGVGIVTRVGTWLGGLLSKGPDADCAWPVSYDRRNFMGISPAPFGKPNSPDPVPWAYHDGLVVDGPGAGPDAFGRKVGVSWWIPPHDYWARVRNWIRNNPYYSPKIPAGDLTAPWDSTGNNYWWRACKVRTLLKWAEHKLPCRTLRAMRWLLGQTEFAPKEMFPDWYELETSVAGSSLVAKENPAVNEMRRKGSRFYASMHMMHKDFWSMAQAQGLARTKEVLYFVNAPGAVDSVVRHFGVSGLGKYDYNPSRPVESWTMGTKDLTLNNLRDALIALSTLEVESAKRLTVSGAPQAKLSLQQAMGVANYNRLQQAVQAAQQRAVTEASTASSTLGTLATVGIPLAGLGALLYFLSGRRSK